MTTRRRLELLHMDLFGPNAYKSLSGNSFGLVMVDDFSTNFGALEHVLVVQI